MRLLSENETALLIGDMSKLKLPDGVELYLSLGVSQIYQKITGLSKPETSKNWLYIPLIEIDSVIQNMSNVPSDSHPYINEIEPLKCDKSYLFPVCNNQKVEIVLVSQTPDLIPLDNRTVECLIDTYNVYKEKNKKYSENHDLFLKTYADNNQSIISFMKAMLNLIVKEIPGSCAGYYSEEHNGLNRRLIVGDLTKFDLLPSYVDEKTKDEWKYCIDKNTNFIPANKLDVKMQFLVQPPEFLLIYNGLSSLGSKNYISVLVPKNVKLASIGFIKTITSMIEKLSESQFVNSSSVIEYYRNQMQDNSSQDMLITYLENLFTLLNKQVRISRLIFIQGEKAIELSYSKSGEYSLNEKSDFKLSEKNKNSLSFSNSDSNIDITIKSEIVQKISIMNNKEGYVIVGSHLDENILRTFEAFINDSIVAFVNIFTMNQFQEAIQKSSHKTMLAENRLIQIDKLSSGYFQQIFSKMTVLLGKTVQINNSIGNFNQNDHSPELINYISQIEENAELISDYVSALNSIVPMRKEYNMRNLASYEMMKSVQQNLRGYLYQTSVTKKLFIRIDNITKASINYLISMSETNDILIPIIISIIDNAIKDGTITINAQIDLGVEFIEISYHHSLTNDNELRNIITSSFENYSISIDEKGQFKINDVEISYVSKSDSLNKIKVQLLKKKSNSNKIVNNKSIGALASV